MPFPTQGSLKGEREREREREFEEWICGQTFIAKKVRKRKSQLMRFYEQESVSSSWHESSFIFFSFSFSSFSTSQLPVVSLTRRMKSYRRTKGYSGNHLLQLQTVDERENEKEKKRERKGMLETEVTVALALAAPVGLWLKSLLASGSLGLQNRFFPCGLPVAWSGLITEIGEGLKKRTKERNTSFTLNCHLLLFAPSYTFTLSLSLSHFFPSCTLYSATCQL